jgi:hypothetical protein
MLVGDKIQLWVKKFRTMEGITKKRQGISLSLKLSPIKCGEVGL